MVYSLLVGCLCAAALVALVAALMYGRAEAGRVRWKRRTEACEDVIERQATELTELAKARTADGKRLAALLAAAQAEYSATLEQVRRDYEAARRDAETLRQDAQMRERARGEAEAVWAKQRAEVADLARTMLAYVERP